MSYYDVYSENFFRIVTNSTGTIIFQYGRIWSHQEIIEQSVWKKNPDMLETALEKAYKSPSRERKEVYNPPSEIRGWNS